MTCNEHLGIDRLTLWGVSSKTLLTSLISSFQSSDKAYLTVLIAASLPVCSTNQQSLKQVSSPGVPELPMGRLLEKFVTQKGQKALF